MKKFNLFFASAIFFLLLFSGHHESFAQTTKEFKWEQYGFKFSVPITHEVRTSSSELFESGDNLTFLQIVPGQNNYSEEEFYQKLIERGGSNILDEDNAFIDYFECYWVHCYADETPEWEYWIIAFHDWLGGEIKFFAYLWWQKGNEQAKQIALEIFNSFRAI